MPGMPEHELKMLPYSQVQQIRQGLREQWQIEADALNKSYFSNRGQFETAKAKLNAKYQQKELEALRGLQSTVNEQKRVRELITQRQGGVNISPQDEATLRMQLRPEAEKLVFPAEKKPASETPLSVSALRAREPEEDITKIQASVNEFASAAKPSKRWHLEWGPHPRDEQSLVQQYRKWKQYVGYDQLDPVVQRQLDFEWDSWMAGDDQYDKWWYDKKNRTPMAEIRALRAKGPGTRAIQRKVTDVTPIGQAVINKKASQPQPRTIRQRNTRTGQERISYDGGKTWQMVSG